MALESFPRISPANFSPENDLIQVYSKKGDYVGVINPSYISGSTSPSGVAGAIQFSNGSAFASDAANLFWDDTNNRLGVGTNNPYAATLHIKGVGTSVGTNAIFVENSAGLPALIVRNNGTVNLPGNLFAEADITVGNGNTSLGARLGIKGSGSTSATTSLLVQNSGGTQTLKITDDGATTIGILNSGICTIYSNYGFIYMGGGSYLGYGFTADETFTYRNVSNVSQWKFSNTGDGVLNGTLSLGNGSVPNASAQLDITSTTKGFLPPRMTTTQINAITSPANGLEVYNTTLACPCFYDGIAWRKVSHTTM